MSRSADFVRGLAALAAAAAFVLTPVAAMAGDAAKGAQVFKRCASCHKVGAGAKSGIGPHLNDVFGRKAGTLSDFKSFSPNMKKAGADGLVWNDEQMHKYLENPRGLIRGTRMAFPGLKNVTERDDVIAYLKQYSKDVSAAPQKPAGTASAVDKKSAAPAAVPAPAAPVRTATAASKSTAVRRDPNAPRHGRFNLGRQATQQEIAAWDIDVRPDGQGLPKGKGTVKQGETIYAERCASCHGDFGEGTGRWPVLAGGKDSLKSDRPEKTIGSYWPYLSTVWDYVHRAMPFGDAQSLTDDQVYAVVAYLLFLNDVVTDEKFELSDKNFTSVRLPNEANFVEDDRAKEPFAKPSEPCMKNCKPGTAKIIMRARILDVTPKGDDKDNAAGKGAIE